MTQKQLAEKSGISQSYLCQLEKDIARCKSPTLQVIDNIASAFEICPIKLIEYDCKACTFKDETSKKSCREKTIKSIELRLEEIKKG